LGNFRQHCTLPQYTGLCFLFKRATQTKLSKFRG